MPRSSSTNTTTPITNTNTENDGTNSSPMAKPSLKAGGGDIEYESRPQISLDTPLATISRAKVAIIM